MLPLEAKTIAPDVWEVVELSNHVVPVVGARKTVFTLHLWAKVSENQHCRVIRTHEYGSDENLEAF